EKKLHHRKIDERDYKNGIRTTKDRFEESDEFKDSLQKVDEWEKEKERRKREEGKSRICHKDIFIDEVTFFSPPSCDTRTNLASDHGKEVNQLEPNMIIDKDVLRDAIHILEVGDLEALVCALLRKKKIELPLGLSRPASLLKAMMELLRVRRRMAEDDGCTLPPSILPDNVNEKEKYRKREMKTEEEEEE
ncbi:hypothetical protein PMAYCL1PPCAC_02221, partial [Pristionchus mayeri]